MKKFRVVIAVLILAVLGVFWYYHLSEKSKENSIDSVDTEVSAVYKAANRDLKNNYPETPREVLLYYISIQKCYYNEEYDDSELRQMAMQAQGLMDEELLEKNPFDKYLDNLKADIEEHKDKKSTLSSYTTSSNSDVLYTTFEEHRYADIECVYYFKDKDGTSKSHQQYTMRKDEDGHWKILASEMVVDDE